MASPAQAVLEELWKVAGTQDLPRHQQTFSDEPCRLRYLSAHKMDAKSAAKALHDTLRWRDEFGADHLTAEMFPEEIAEGRVYVCSANSEAGNPVIVVRKRTTPPPPGNDYADRQLKFLVYTLETAVKKMGPNTGEWTVILDLSGYSRANSAPFSTTYAALQIFTKHFPGRLRKAFIVDSPSVFGWLWAMVYPFLERVTYEKIAFVKSKKFRGQPVVADTFSEFVARFDDRQSLAPPPA